MKILAIMFMALLLIGSVNAQIAVSSFSSNPKVIAPGKEVTVNVDVENVGEDEIKDILVKLDLTSVPFAPLNSASEKAIDSLDEDDVESLEFRLVALPDASSQIYKIPVKISYGTIVKDSLISLQVSGQSRLDVVLETNELVKVGDKGKVIIKLVNNGLSEIKFLTVKLNQGNGYELLSADSIYIGQIDVDDFETAEFDMIAKQEDPVLIVSVEYRDQNNKEYMQTKAVNLNVYSLEEAKQLGLVQNSYLGWVALPIVFLVIGYFWYRRRKRKKLNI